MASAKSFGAAACPALESGDRMDRDEFHRRYLLRPDIKKAELINGVVYVASPVRITQHASPHFRLITKLGVYAEATPGVEGADNGSILIGPRDEPQPDVMLFWDEAHGGQLQLDDEGYAVTPPELAAEVSASSLSYDLHDKKDLYQRAGVRENIVWQVEEGRIDWWILVDGVYTPRAPDAGGVIHSVVFPGLDLDVRALAGDSGAG